jgi:hypothetical protein
MQQDRAALEDRDVAIGEPGDLAEGLVGELVGLAIAEWGGFDAVWEASFFQGPVDAEVADVAAGELGNPVEGGMRGLRVVGRSYAGTRGPRQEGWVGVALLVRLTGRHVRRSATFEVAVEGSARIRCE